MTAGRAGGRRADGRRCDDPSDVQYITNVWNKKKNTVNVPNLCAAQVFINSASSPAGTFLHLQLVVSKLRPEDSLRFVRVSLQPPTGGLLAPCWLCAVQLTKRVSRLLSFGAKRSCSRRLRQSCCKSPSSSSKWPPPPSEAATRAQQRRR